MIRSSDATTVLWIIYLFRPTSIDVTLVDVLFLNIYAIYTAMYNITSVLWIRRDQKLNRGRMLYRVAQNKWVHLLKLCMGCFLTIKINYNDIVVSVCVFSMMKPVQCLLNIDRKWTLSISVIVSTKFEYDAIVTTGHCKSGPGRISFTHGKKHDTISSSNKSLSLSILGANLQQ